MAIDAGKALSRKFGPLPAYGWLGILAGGAYFFWHWAGGGQTATTDPTTGTVTTPDTQPQGFPNYPIINIQPNPKPDPVIPPPAPVVPPKPTKPPKPHDGGGGSQPSSSGSDTTRHDPTNPDPGYAPQEYTSHAIQVPGVGGAGGNSTWVSTPGTESGNVRFGSGPATD